MQTRDASERASGAQVRRPNIVVIVADDLGYGDLGCYSHASRIPTPNIDALAAGGVRMLDAHAPAAVCTPSRYGLLTGRFGWRSTLPRGVLYGYEPPLIEAGRPTLASWLRSAGYQTAAIGKWHLGLGFHLRRGTWDSWLQPLPWPETTPELEREIDVAAGVSGGPTSLGFDTFFGTSGCPTCQPPFAFIEDERFPEPPTSFDAEPPFTGRPGLRSASWRHSEADPAFTARAVSYIRDRVDDDRPFFLYLASDAPHEPCVEEAVPEFARRKSEAGWRGDLVWLFDWMVGEVVAALRETGVLENTLLIVTSDHGALPGDRVSDDERGDPPGMAGYHTYGHRASGPWRGYKAHIWEGGHRVPFVASWPNRVPAGETSSALTCHTDLMSTLSQLIDVPLPAGAAEDGTPFASALLGTQAGDRGRTSLVHHSQTGAFAVRAGNWKCIFGTRGSGGWPPPADGLPAPVVCHPEFPTARAFEGGGTGQLYDLVDDPGERRNLWSDRPDIVLELAAMLHAVRTGSGQPTRS